MSLRYPLCIHPTLRDFVGTVNVDAGHRIHLCMAGAFAGADPRASFDIRVQTEPRITLPRPLRAYIRLGQCAAGFTCDGSTCASYTAPLEHGVLRWTCPLIDCETWQLSVPYLPYISLERLIGMRPVHVVVSQGEREYARFVIQRMQHCVHLHSSSRSRCLPLGKDS